MQKVDRSYLIWHPFSQMKGTEALPKVISANGAWLQTEEGLVFDAISSWWVNLHGHAHPHIASAIAEQAKKLEHVIFAGFTHDPAIELCHRLTAHLPKGSWKFFFSDNGSTAIEVALKMAIQYFRAKDQKRKVNVVAFEGSYHGDTFGAMAAGARGVFTDWWDDLFFEAIHIPLPVGTDFERSISMLEQALDYPTVFIYEPLVQGAGGMRMYDADALKSMQRMVRESGGITIADEVMTGFGRLGTWFASLETEKPDMICLSKGLTGGALPMALTVCDQRFYDAFLDDRFEKGFLHGHSFTGNPLGCAAALASLDLLEEEGTWTSIRNIEQCYARRMEELNAQRSLHNLRMKGSILAMDVVGENAGYVHPLRDRLYHEFMSRKLLLRPLGNVVYLLPPYCSSGEEIDHAIDAIIEVSSGV